MHIGARTLPLLTALALSGPAGIGSCRVQKRENQTDRIDRTPHKIRYSVIDLGTLGGQLSFGYGLNAQGDVVGWAYTAKLSIHAFLWRGGKMRDLGVPQGFPISEARCISASGAVSGYCAEADRNNLQIFLWKEGRLNLLGKGDGFGINDTGDLVGQSGDHAFLYRQGKLLDLGTLGGDQSAARAINRAGHIAGRSYTAERDRHTLYHAFFYDGRKMSDLGDLGGKFSEAYGLNDQDEVVGCSFLGGRGLRAFLWSRDRGMKDLGTLGGSRSIAYGINNRTQIVGFSYLVEKDGRAVLWEHGKLYDLNDLVPPDDERKLVEARAINDRGQIVATGKLNDQPRAFLLTPLAGTARPAGKQNKRPAKK